jgi:hypothetical protein
VTENHHLTVEDAARRDRLDAAMTTRAARWCQEQVVELQRSNEAASSYAGGPGRLAWDLASSYAKNLIRLVWQEGEDPTDPVVMVSVWRHRALTAYSELWHLVAYPSGVVSPVWDSVMADLEAADAAGVWALESERIAR